MMVMAAMSGSNERLQGVKIARVATVAFFVETQLRSQIGAIVQAGGQVTIVASEARLGCEISGTRYVSVEIPRRIDPLKDIVALVRLWSFFRRSGFQIVHSTTPKAGLLCSLAAKLARVPVRLHTFTGQPWVSLCGIKRFLAKSSDWLITLLNTRCYADSPSQKDFIVESGVASAERVSVLGAGSLAGIDLQRFNPSNFSDEDRLILKAQLGIPPGARVLLFVGRLARDKGIAELLTAYREVLDKQSNVFLVLLGPHEVETATVLDGLSDALRKNLAMPGFSDEPERFMAIADLLLLPSYREGFGTVVIEAAAMGVPTIGTDIYGLSDAIVNGKTGLLVPVRNAAKLAAAINALLQDSTLRLEMGANARARVEREFSNVRVNGLIIDEYVGLLDANKERR